MGKAKRSMAVGETLHGENKMLHGPVQHDRAMSRREAHEYLSQQTGYRPAQLRAAFLGLAKALAANAARGNSSTIDGVASFRNVAKGAFESVHGPWRPV